MQHLVKDVAHALGFDHHHHSKVNSIFVQLNQPVYTGGDVVSGTVFMNVLETFTANGVIVKIRGFEYAAWEEWRTEQKEGGQTERHLHVHKEKREFFKDVIRVYPHSGIVNPGQYQFPFTYQLPSALPGSFTEKGGHWSQGTGHEGQVGYFAKGKVDAKKHPLNYKQFFVVNEKFDKSVQPSFAENSKTFMFTKGRLHARVWLDRNVYFPGDTVIAKLEANNTSVKPTTKLSVKVFKHLHLQAGSHRHEHSQEIYHQNYKGFEPSFYGVRWLPFNIPVNIQPSTSTAHLVRCTYFFIVECDIPGALDLDIKLPTAIMAPQWLYSTAPPAPPVTTLPPDVSFRPPWQPDEQAGNCTGCSAKFGLFKRRHHCRHCGRVFCDGCTNHQMKIPALSYDEPVRVCHPCHKTVESTGGSRYQEASAFPPNPPAIAASAPPVQGDPVPPIAAAAAAPPPQY
jgi:hypothetical protein